jgi:Tfp pilus assembly protein PilE
VKSAAHAPRPSAGFTLVELVVFIAIMGMGTMLAARTFMNRAGRRADVDGIKALITLASRRSLTESRHFGVHYDSTNQTIGLFEDVAKDNLFNGFDTLTSILKIDTLATMRLVNSLGQSSKDMTFKKNGTLAPEISFQLDYVGRYHDTCTLQIIAASGQVMQLR